MKHFTAHAPTHCTIDDAQRGLANREFFFVYQPKLRMGEGRLSGFESLLRWNHPSFGVLAPASFIHLVEDSPLTGSFTDFITADATRTLADWSVRGYDTLSLAINLPAAEIARPGLASKLSALCCSRSVRTSRLQIELTESSDPGSIEKLASAVESLKKSGISVAIDDFGAGCWSLAILHRLGVDTLKLDRKFMCGIQDNANSKVVVESLIELGQRLGKRVVIEGIETAEQFAWLKTIEQIECQGYYISAPVADEQIGELVARHGMVHQAPVKILESSRMKMASGSR
ncbi:EAL domain-containing protein [Paraburkholderia sp. ZP32-5]|uniref:EAL domain-containing protein n=1 Tax=Paraburkholderia sp. ZP32-5 TaxID=2883245 RepID=UPI001F1D4212|nr:EAL domain-containing protein [Paraburkholderia sp. ZP32-5]